jgi:hypothetical protein
MDEVENTETAWTPTPYIAANGHKMVQTNPKTYWDAVCTDDCKACSESEERPDW